MAIREVSQIRSHIPARSVGPLMNFDAQDYRDLRSIGIDITDRALDAMIDAIDATGMDALQPSITTPTIPTAIQFLQTWLPGFVRMITVARKIDQLVGISTVGAWEDEEIVQGVLEQLGSAVPYGDLTAVPLSSWNLGYTNRTVIRFEEGLQVGLLEEARTARMKVNTADEKRSAATMALEIQRNSVGFYGFNNGDNQTYGLLNDPNLPVYQEFAPGAGAGAPTQWSGKTFQEITKDLRGMFSYLRTVSGDTIDPRTDATIMGIGTATIDFLSITTDFGESVQDWLTKTYPKCVVISAPEFDAANGGLNVVYLYATRVQDSSTDDGGVFMQAVPTKLRTLGVKQNIKNYEEDYGNATAGVLCKRPYAVTRWFGN